MPTETTTPREPRTEPPRALTASAPNRRSEAVEDYYARLRRSRDAAWERLRSRL